MTLGRVGSGPAGEPDAADHRPSVRATIVALVALVAVIAAPTGADAQEGSDRFDDIVERLLELPFDPGYVPTGTDDAFGPNDHPSAFPVTDTTTGTCCTSPVPDQPPLADLAPPFAVFPEGFELIELESYDGTPLHAYVAIAAPGAPAVVVAHGFNTNGKHSIVRYAAAMYANGFSVIAPDHRDMGREWERGGSWHPSGERRGQTIGWKESEDFLVAAEEMRRRGAPAVGMLGFSEGAQNAILAADADLDGVIDAIMTFSAPADQATLYQRNEAAIRALLLSVVNEADLCDYLGDVGEREEFSASPNFILRHDSAVGALDGTVRGGVDVPGIHFLAADDTLVPDWNAVALASRTLAMPWQETILIEAGNHAYFYDRWWTQAAALQWFTHWLDPDGAFTTAEPTVAEPLSGSPIGEQTVDLADTTREDGDAELRDQDICDPADEPIGPTALLRVDGDGATWNLDGRRSYSGWDDHELAAWSIDPGDGGDPVAGTDPLEAIVTHTYERSGTYEVALTVTDDTGRQRTATRAIEVTVEGDAADPGADRDETTDTGPLPETGAGVALYGALLLLVAGRLLVGRGARD